MTDEPPRQATSPGIKVTAHRKPEKSGKTPKKKQQTSVLDDLLLLLLKIFIIVLLFVLMFTFLFGATRYKEAAMEPNIKTGDLVLFYRVDKRYVATNVVALKYKGETQIYRVVAIAGDTVDMTNQGLVINGALQSEPDETKQTLPYTNGIDFPITLKTGEIFVLGDDRTNSVDSRIFGPVQSKDTLGEVIAVIRRRNI